MNPSDYRICLDVQQPHGAVELDMKQGDTNRRIYITLTDGGRPYLPGEGCCAVFTAKKPDEKVIYNQCAVTNNTVVYGVTAQTTACAGTVRCELRLYSREPQPDEQGRPVPGEDCQLLTSAAFTIAVHPQVCQDADVVASVPESTVLQGLVADTEALIKTVQTKLDNGEFVGEKGEPGEVNIDDSTVAGDSTWSSEKITDFVQARAVQVDICYVPDTGEITSSLSADDIFGYFEQGLRVTGVVEIGGVESRTAVAEMHLEQVVKFTVTTYGVFALFRNGQWYFYPEHEPVYYDTAQELTREQRAQAMDNIGASEALGLRSQGRSAKYKITKPGWKRILNVIRASNGSLHLGLAKAVGGGGISAQALGIQFTGNVNLVDSVDPTDPVPVMYQMYDHEMGHNNNPDTPDFHARITKVRVGYPKEYTDTFTNIPEGDAINYRVNNINCYVDVYVDFTDVQGGDTVDINMNYAGFADSHYCEAITGETDAADTGIYGETLDFCEFTPTKDATVYMPEGKLLAQAVGADSGSFQKMHSAQGDFDRLEAQTVITPEMHADNVMDRSELIASFCPNISLQTASLFQCYPMKDSQLEIRYANFNSNSAVSFVHCGKNLNSYKGGAIAKQQFYNSAGNQASKYGYVLMLPPGTYTMHAVRSSNYKRTGNLYGMINNSLYSGAAAYKGMCRTVKGGTILDPVTFTITSYYDRIYIYDGEATNADDALALLTSYDIQIEAGSVKTDYEPYVGGQYRTPTKRPAFDGVNTIYSHTGSGRYTLAIKGKEDPVKYFEDLKNAIVALGGNV